MLFLRSDLPDLPTTESTALQLNSSNYQYQSGQGMSSKQKCFSVSSSITTIHCYVTGASGGVNIRAIFMGSDGEGTYSGANWVSCTNNQWKTGTIPSNTVAIAIWGYWSGGYSKPVSFYFT